MALPGNRKCALILLAAGGSARFGNQPKQLAVVRGKGLLRRTAEAAAGSGADPVCVVLGAAADRLADEVNGLPVLVTVNGNWPEGMASSIASGLDAVREAAPEIEAVCISLADQPLVDSGILRRLIAVWADQPEKIVAARYAGTLGVPAVFPAAYFDEIRSLKADAGAKSVIRRHPDSVVGVDVPEAAVDIDTADDLARHRS